jgi:hypothetical protein
MRFQFFVCVLCEFEKSQKVEMKRRKFAYYYTQQQQHQGLACLFTLGRICVASVIHLSCHATHMHTLVMQMSQERSYSTHTHIREMEWVSDNASSQDEKIKSLQSKEQKEKESTHLMRWKVHISHFDASDFSALRLSLCVLWKAKKKTNLFRNHIRSCEAC